MKIYFIIIIWFSIILFISCEQTPASIDVRAQQIETIEGSSPETVEIKDGELKSCVYNALNLSANDVLTKSKAESLRELSCPSEKIAYLDGLQYFENLRDLSLPASRIVSVDKYFFWRMIKLQSMTLSFENLGYFDGDIFFNLKKLVYLDLKWSGINYIDSYSFYNLKNLKTLILSNNKIEYIGSGFVGLSNLKTLIISDNKINEVKKEELSDLLLIENVVLKGNYLTDFDLKIISMLPTLKRIDLSENCFTEETVEYITSNCDICIMENQEPQNCVEN